MAHTPKNKDEKNVFWTKFLNNRMAIGLLILLLVLINLWVFTKIAYLFVPITAMMESFMMPVLVSVILYYLFAPLVNQLQRHGINKTFSVLTIFVLIIFAVSLSIGAIIPIVREQTQMFIENIPNYYNTIIQSINSSEWIDSYLVQSDYFDVNALLSNFSLENLTERMNTIITSTFGGIGSIVGTVTSTFTGILIVPIILYYLLVSGEQLPKVILYYVPTRHRNTVSRMLYQGNYQVSRYIRGQIIVAVCVGIMFGIGYAIIGLDYGTTLAVIAGFLNIIPFLGSFIAVIPALIIGLITSPTMLIKVIIVMTIEQTIEGRFISPQVLGNSLKIHPVTILFILLGAGKVFGLLGVVIGVPIYAVIKVIVSELYTLYRTSSDAYAPDEDMYIFPEGEMVIVEDYQANELHDTMYYEKNTDGEDK